MCLARRKLWIGWDRHTRSLESGYRRKWRKLSFGCFLRIRHIYPASPLSLTADSAHSVQVSDRAERHNRELPSGLIQSSLRTLPQSRRRLQHCRAHQLMPDSPSMSRFRHGYGCSSHSSRQASRMASGLGWPSPAGLFLTTAATFGLSQPAVLVLSSAFPMNRARSSQNVYMLAESSTAG